MASRMSESMALVKRCENAGWRTERVADGWKIYPERGRPMVVHLTYSDVKAINTIRGKLEKNGLKEAEEALTATKDETRLAKLEAQRQAAFSAAEEISQKAQQAHAAGQFLTPKAEKILWYAGSHPRPWMQWVIMTPEIAKYLIDAHNTDNRPLRPKVVQHYKNIILSGQWKMTHQGAAMDTRGVLQDGQHRLAAIVEASQEIPGLKVPMAFFVGMPEENFKAIDEGLLRSTADLFGKDGESCSGVISTCCRLSIAFLDQNPRRMMRQKFTNQKVYDFFQADPENIRAAAKFGAIHYKKAYTTTAPLSAAAYLLRKTNGADNRYVEAFLAGLTTGRKAGTKIALDDDDPREVVRRHFEKLKMRRERITGIESLSIIILAWNNIVTGRSPRFVKFADDSDIPRITICADKGPNASGCPAALTGEIDDDEEG